MDLKFKLLIDRLVFSFNRILYFVIPNLKKIFSGQIKLEKDTIFYQTTLFQGKGLVKMGEGCVFGYKLGGFNRNGTIEIQARHPDSQIIIGNNVLTNNNIFFCSANYIEIGDNTLVGQNVTLMDFEAHGIPINDRHKIGEIGKIIVGKNCWIGNNVTILKNSIIGDNSIVAVGSVVSGVFPGNVIIGGVPAKIIKSIQS